MIEICAFEIRLLFFMIVIFCVQIDDVCISFECLKLHHHHRKYYYMIMNLMTSLLYIFLPLYINTLNTLYKHHYQVFMWEQIDSYLFNS